jgi:hypothetical protein
MRTLLVPVLLLTATGAPAGDRTDPSAVAYANWQRCLRQQIHVRPGAPDDRCAVAETAYHKALGASPLLDPSDVARSRNGLRAQAAGSLDPTMTGSIGSRPSR